MIEVESKVRCYEIDGKDTPMIDTPRIIVRGHWNIDTFVVLEIDGKRYTVSAKDLHAAINNATNTARF